MHPNGFTDRTMCALFRVTAWINFPHFHLTLTRRATHIIKWLRHGRQFLHVGKMIMTQSDCPGQRCER